MRVKSIILLENNATLLQELTDELSSSNEYHITYAGDNGDEGIRCMLQEKPDLIIVGMFLKGTDGEGVIQKAKKTWPNVKILATGIANDDIIERTFSFGVNYYLVKPFSVESAIEKIQELLSKEKNQESRELVSAHRKPVTIEEKISEIFISIGIPPHIKGYTYLREAIKLMIDKPYIINSVTKELYPTVAKRYATTSSKVERAIRHAIEVAWNRGRIDAINAIFGSRIYLGSEKPTNSEFIALVADKLILESMI